MDFIKIIQVDRFYKRRHFTIGSLLAKFVQTGRPAASFNPISEAQFSTHSSRITDVVLVNGYSKSGSGYRKSGTVYACVQYIRGIPNRNPRNPRLGRVCRVWFKRSNGVILPI